MNDDVRKYIYGTLIVFVAGVLIWVAFIFVNACGFTFTCKRGALAVERTPMPTLIPATLPVLPRYVSVPTLNPGAGAATPMAGTGTEVARPSNPGGPGEAVNLTGTADAGAQVFAANCIPCHGAEGVGGVPNAGSTDGTVPALNPIDPTLIDADHKTYAANLDLFIQHGSRPAGTNPTFQMPAWGDTGALTQQQVADVIAYLISLNP